jgi:hypothetical protein
MRKYIILGLVAAMGLFGGGLCLAEADLSAQPGDSPAIADIKQRIAKVSEEVEAWNQRNAATVENASRTVVAPRDQAPWRPDAAGIEYRRLDPLVRTEPSVRGLTGERLVSAGVLCDDPMPDSGAKASIVAAKRYRHVRPDATETESISTSVVRSESAARLSRRFSTSPVPPVEP